jgi:hypothetical protein
MENNVKYGTVTADGWDGRALVWVKSKRRWAFPGNYPAEKCTEADLETAIDFSQRWLSPVSNINFIENKLEPVYENKELTESVQIMSEDTTIENYWSNQEKITSLYKRYNLFLSINTIKTISKYILIFGSIYIFGLILVYIFDDYSLIMKQIIIATLLSLYVYLIIRISQYAKDYNKYIDSMINDELRRILHKLKEIIESQNNIIYKIQIKKINIDDINILEQKKQIDIIKKIIYSIYPPI